MDKICIRVPKVFDWVRKRIELPTICFDKLAPNDHKDWENHCDGFSDDPCRLLKCGKAFIECFLSDSEGNPLDPAKKNSFICSSEILEGRDVIGTLPSCEKTRLQRVKVTIKGFIVIEILNVFGFPICTSNPIPFSVTETFFLCAPKGTNAECEVTFFRCDTNLICSEHHCFEQLDISIVICVDVQTTAEIKLELDAALCEIREDLPPELIECPPADPPPQCPELFPIKKKS